MITKEQLNRLEEAVKEVEQIAMGIDRSFERVTFLKNDKQLSNKGFEVRKRLYNCCNMVEVKKIKKMISEADR